ncbi:PTS system mannose/fructose/N-acetylgalactosamine-transporter subunit IIB [Breznakia pachnodae]|uniref:Mannose/fructose/N-acetylgalactosamine-specific phosphotransferase system component IIB n=1 Tax=Breznakia pachnodae TaxID=265178 RepID=A0ABU0E0C0_9FIRM|nr:PTS sugar transporter subunit IIB [Breznakia pachnodae]MDQ0360333.1 mannose/fructose/N-acetylgalactosamine-specific phosphotransferase system component IIB [Breznakia pachnodae]
MNEIKLARVDFRLMHGQVITNWVKQVSANHILVVDEELEKNQFMAQVYLMAAPPGIKVNILSPERAVKNLLAGKFSKVSLLVLFKSVESAKETFDLGLSLDRLQIGGLGSGTGRVMISNQLSLDEKEALLLKEMGEKGVDIFFQAVPKEPEIPLSKALEKVL